jgi:hypothetical protein
MMKNTTLLFSQKPFTLPYDMGDDKEFKRLIGLIRNTPPIFIPYRASQLHPLS